MVLLHSAPLSWLKPAAFAFGLLYNTAPYPEGSPSLPSVPEGALLPPCPPGLHPKGSCPSSPPCWQGQLMRLSTELQALASPTSLLTTGVGVMLTPYWLVIFWKQG